MNHHVLAITGAPGGSEALSSNADLAVFFLVGILAGAHCLGMCGPLVTTYADRMRAREESTTGRSATQSRPGATLSLYEVRQHALFNLGRAGSYALVGALFGLLGAVAFTSVDAVAAVGDTVRGAVGVAVGIAILASGTYYLRGRAAIPHGLPIAGPALQRVTGALLGHVDRLANSPGIVALGALHGLLPCPINYPAYLYAFALGSPLRGAASLAALGLGTIPTLFAYGTLLGSLGTQHRVRLHRVLGVGFLVLGYVPLQHGVALLFGVYLPHLPIPFYQPL